MKIRIQKKIGSSTFIFDTEKEKMIDALTDAAFLACAPEKCGLCQSVDVTLSSNKAESFTFIKIKCLKCGAASNMGTYKDSSGYFWKEFLLYKKEEE